MSHDLSVPAARISERMGLHFPQDRWPDLARGLERAAASLGLDSVHTLISRLLGDSFGQPEIQALATHLTIGETHFFRSPETFAMLQSHLLPELIAAQKDTTRRLRIWSAGCATGQEAYSLAILVSRLLPRRADWDVTILATDINPEVLKGASKAEYTQWSFRGTPSWVINGYFTRTNGDRYLLDPVIRDMVTFRYFNLVDDIYPSLATGMHNFDLILCRNVLMYFSREVAKRVADRLQRAIRENGYLLVTPSEASHDIQCALTQLIRGGEILYKKTPIPAPTECTDVQRGATELPVSGKSATRKRGRSDCAAGTSRSRSVHGAGSYPATAKTRQLKQAAVERRGPGRPFAAYAERLAAGRAERPGKQAAPQDAAKEARLLANKGHLEQALAHCEAALEGDKLNPSLYYLKASVLQELGRSDEAERALQSTLFLDGNFGLARVMLGAIARGQSRSGEAAKHFGAALSLFQQMPSDTVLPETDGLTAGEIAEMVATMMESECVS